MLISPPDQPSRDSCKGFSYGERCAFTSAHLYLGFKLVLKERCLGSHEFFLKLIAD
jgi:hypothetical protein